MHTPTALADTVLVVTDGTLRSHAIIDQILRSDRNVVVTGESVKALVPYLDAGVHDRVWAVISDPSDSDQINSIIERATDKMGPVIMVIDPAGQLADINAADRSVA